MFLQQKRFQFVKHSLHRLAYMSTKSNMSDMDLQIKLQSEESPIQPIINTLVFLDTESTGLPSFQSPKTVQVTELCMVAVNRKHFDDPSFNFRIFNKINLCIKPRSEVSPVAATMSGLNNMDLETQQKFSTSTANLLKMFLDQLEPPICLLAHNGNNFDFPLVKAEMNNVQGHFSDDILVLDTCSTLRELVPPPGYNSPSSAPSSPSTNISKLEDIINNGRIMQEFSTPPKQKRVKYPMYSPKSTNGDKIGSPTILNKLDARVCQLDAVDLTKTAVFIPETPPKPSNPQSSQLCETPTKPQRKGGNFLRKNLFPNLEDNNLDDPENQLSICRNQDGSNIEGLDSDKKSVKNILVGGPWKKNVKGYRLSDLYQRVIGEPFQDAHAAEADTIALLKLCFHVKHFSTWMDAKAKSISEVKTMW